LPRLWDKASGGAVPDTLARIRAAFQRDVVAEQRIMDVHEPVAELPVVRVPSEQKHRRDGDEDGAEDHAESVEHLAASSFTLRLTSEASRW
jgi:hypothetical protein